MKYLKLFENKLYSIVTSAYYTRTIDSHILFSDNDKKYLKSKSNELGCDLNIMQAGSTHRMMARFVIIDNRFGDESNYILLVITKIYDDYYLIRFPNSHHQNYKCDQIDGLEQFFNENWNKLLEIKKEVSKVRKGL